MADAVQKTCSVCGIDVSGKPRVKDSAGRYLCQDCVAKAKAARGAQTAKPPAPPARPGAAAPGADDDNTFLLNIGGKSSVAEKGTTPCPECGRPLVDGTVVCVGCGFNTKTNKRTQVKVEKAKPAPGEKAESSRGGNFFSDQPHLVGLGMLLVFGALGAGVMVVPEIHILYLILAGVMYLASRVWALFAAWQDETWKGILILISWVFGILWLYELYWVLVEAENVLLKWMWVVSLVALIVGFFLNPEILSATP
ncbi:MAG: hypothetical protein SFY69_07865 [Planctomycetota bacterium]|nr:hypothetical protein [Planctomycetota bacterium]